MINWYTMIPIDTLLFKGAEPMERGENHFASSIFPPPTITLAGAIRTLYLKQNKISFNDYIGGNVSVNVIKDIGKAGEEPPFNILGPLLMKGEEIFVATPYNWYEKSEAKSNCISNHYRTEIFKSELVVSNLFRAKKKVYWVKETEDNLKTIGGKWIRYNDLINTNFSDEVEIFLPSYFYLGETRTGVALDFNRNVKEGHLYTFTHIRLKEDVKILIGITKNLSIYDEGILKLGAEQRFVKYKKLKVLKVSFENNGCEFMSLSPLKYNQKLEDVVIATGKIKYIGGWDLKKGFHKPVIGYYPAGSVFGKKVSDNTIKIR